HVTTDPKIRHKMHYQPRKQWLLPWTHMRNKYRWFRFLFKLLVQHPKLVQSCPHFSCRTCNRLFKQFLSYQKVTAYTEYSKSELIMLINHIDIIFIQKM